MQVGNLNKCDQIGKGKASEWVCPTCLVIITWIFSSKFSTHKCNGCQSSIEQMTPRCYTTVEVVTAEGRDCNNSKHKCCKRTARFDQTWYRQEEEEARYANHCWALMTPAQRWLSWQSLLQKGWIGYFWNRWPPAIKLFGFCCGYLLRTCCRFIISLRREAACRFFGKRWNPLPQ